MEIGFGFLVGVLGGGVLALIVAVIVVASRRAIKRNPPPAPAPIPTETAGRSLPEPDGGRPPVKTVTNQSSRTGSGGHTIVIAEMEARDSQLNRSIQEVRDLLLNLADVIGSTKSASGKANLAFANAKDAVHEIDLSDVENSDELLAAQRVLLEEIERVLANNAELHGQLEKANTGIAEQRRQIEELRVQARVDALTRIPNRAAFDERLKEYVGLIERTSLIFTLMLLDIDHFKRVNDTHGHTNGDRILRGVAAKISACVRNNDFAARYGGEEFAVIFPGTTLKDAELVADRMRQDIARTNFRMDNQNVKVSVSGGLAECSRGMTSRDIVDAADKALYFAKNGGRNRVMTTNDLNAKAES